MGGLQVWPQRCGMDSITGSSTVNLLCPKCCCWLWCHGAEGPTRLPELRRSSGRQGRKGPAAGGIAAGAAAVQSSLVSNLESIV